MSINDVDSGKRNKEDAQKNGGHVAMKIRKVHDMNEKMHIEFSQSEWTTLCDFLKRSNRNETVADKLLSIDVQIQRQKEYERKQPRVDTN